MKNINIIASVALIFISGASMAQGIIVFEPQDPREEFHFGIKAGVNYANIYDNNTDEFNANQRFGFVGGVFARIPFGLYFGFQPELLYSQKGFDASGTMFGGEYEFKRTSSYLDIPLLLSLKPAEFLTILAGPQYSYLLSQKDESKNNNLSMEQEEVFMNDDIRNSTFGLVVGLDLNLHPVILGMRMGWDFQNNNGNNNGNGDSEAPSYKNAWVQGTVGILFNR